MKILDFYIVRGGEVSSPPPFATGQLEEATVWCAGTREMDFHKMENLWLIQRMKLLAGRIRAITFAQSVIVHRNNTVVVMIRALQ